MGAIACLALPGLAIGQTPDTGLKPVGGSQTEVQGEVPIPAGEKPDRNQGGGGDASGDGGSGAAGGTAGAAASGAAPAAASSDLPFTGIDLLTLTGVALVMTGFGLGLRQVIRPPSRA